MNIVSILKGIKSRIKDLEGNLEKFTKLIDGIDEKILSKITSIWQTKEIEILSKMDEVEVNVRGQNKAEIEAIKVQFLKEIEDLKKIIESSTIDLSELSEFDIDGDGEVSLDEYLAGLKEEYEQSTWSGFLASVFENIHEEFGDEFTNKTFAIAKINDIFYKLDIPIQKWLHLWVAFIGNLK